MDSSHALPTTETFAGQAVESPRWRRTATKILNGPIISLGILAALVFVESKCSALALHLAQQEMALADRAGALVPGYHALASLAETWPR